MRACRLREQLQGQPLQSEESQLVRRAQLPEHASGKLLDPTVAKVPDPLQSHTGRPELSPPLLAHVQRQHPHLSPVEKRVMPDSRGHEVNGAAGALVRFRGGVMDAPGATQGDRQTGPLILMWGRPGSRRVVEEGDENSPDIDGRCAETPRTRWPNR